MQVQIKSAEFQPKNEYLLVLKDSHSETVSQGGIVIPLMDTGVNARSTSGTVISVGKDITDIAENDFVLWPGTDGLDIEFIDGEFLLLRYKSVIGTKKK